MDAKEFEQLQKDIDTHLAIVKECLVGVKERISALEANLVAQKTIVDYWFEENKEIKLK